MTLRTRARYVIAAIVLFIGVAATGLHFFAEWGQWGPAGMTNDATKSDQRDPAVSQRIDKR